jgi:hypothetical protein
MDRMKGCVVGGILERYKLVKKHMIIRIAIENIAGILPQEISCIEKCTHVLGGSCGGIAGAVKPVSRRHRYTVARKEGGEFLYHIPPRRNDEKVGNDVGRPSVYGPQMALHDV